MGDVRGDGLGVSRRDLIRWGLMGGGASLLAACRAAEQGAGPTAAAPSSTAPPPTSSSLPPGTTLPVDPSVPYWLQGNYAPVFDEVEAFDLEVRGALPSTLRGQYVKNSSNPPRSDSPHWFFGDGMVHGVNLDSGRALSYRNRYVRTEPYVNQLGFGKGSPGGANSQSNVSALWHGGRLLTSGEVGFPYHLDPATLDTIGPLDFGGTLTQNFTAHPKIDPATGRMHAFGYGFAPPYLWYYVIEPDGTMSSVIPVERPYGSMIHDFAITETDVVFWDLPVVFDLELAIQYINDPSSGATPFAWRPEAGAHVGVMPLGGPASAITWFELDPCYVFHGVNAFRRGDAVVLDVCRLTSMFEQGGDDRAAEQSLRRWTVNTASGAVTDDILETVDSGDLPTRDPRRLGRDYRYAYLVGSRENPHTVELGDVIKHDFVGDSRVRWNPGPTRHATEPMFLPADDDTAEDAGWLLTFVHDDATGESVLAVLDATDVPSGPVAEVVMPQRVPYGFHATWVPADPA